MAVNFVKFQRGSPEAYAALKRNNRVDSDTLYFLYDSANPETGGDLYLGYTLIGGTSTSGSGSGVSALKDLDDVIIPETIASGAILQFSVARNKWVTKSLATALEDLQSSGAASFGPDVTVETALAQGQTVSNFLTTITNPKEGDIAVVAGSPYVYDGTSWVSLTNSDVLDRISTLETKVAALENQVQTIRGEIDTKIAAANHLTYQVLEIGQTINDIDTTSPNINKTVFLVPNNNSAGNSYDEYMYVNGQFEKLGAWEANLSGYVTTQTLNTAVSNIQNQLDQIPNNYVTLTKYNSEVGSMQPILQATGKSSTTISAEIVDMYDRLKWNPIPTA